MLSRIRVATFYVRGTKQDSFYFIFQLCQLYLNKTVTILHIYEKVIMIQGSLVHNLFIGQIQKKTLTSLGNAMLYLLSPGLYILLLNPQKLPNFLTKFPTEPEVNLSHRRLRLLHQGRFHKKVIISPYFSLSEGENCPKLYLFGIKLSRLELFWGKISKIWKFTAPEVTLIYLDKRVSVFRAGQTVSAL